MAQAVRSIKNQYRGVNAHLHSYWQTMGGWSRFHTHHIADIMRTLRPLLLPLGYDADVETSLQIRRMDEPFDIQHVESDVTIYDIHPVRKPTPVSSPTVNEVLMPIPQALFGEPLSEKQLSAIKIYQLRPGKNDPGIPVAWIELLSPSNKPGGQDADEYFEKRYALLDSGLVFIEIDYLHEYAPTLKGIPSYRVRRGMVPDPRAHAYRIAILDPRPDLRQGMTASIEFDVDSPIPTVRLPLSGEDHLAFDFGIPYRKSYEETLYGFRLVDYAQFPLHFDRYNDADQARIASRMIAVIRSWKSGQNLESDPLPTEALPVDLALEQLTPLLHQLNQEE
ncbi:MAG: DUF4058 family protein [bacterium]|nr:DUF4058 family protein [bacterium]